MNTNDIAIMHFLTTTEKLFFKNVLAKLYNKIELIKKDNKLEGKWILSDDLQWLMKEDN